MTATLTKHPAPYSPAILVQLAIMLDAEWLRQGKGALHVLDPFAGTGRIHQLHQPGGIETVGVELEPEWAAMHERTVVGNVFDLPAAIGRRRYDVIATSPCYGNRFADSHNPKDPSVRRSYKFDLGRDPSDQSASTLRWGPAYWRFHADAYRAMLRSLKPGGLVLLNVSDFIRDKRVVHAMEWHMGALAALGLDPAGRAVFVPTSRMRYGANHKARVTHEVILPYRKPT